MIANNEGVPVDVNGRELARTLREVAEEDGGEVVRGIELELRPAQREFFVTDDDGVARWACHWRCES